MLRWNLTRTSGLEAELRHVEHQLLLVEQAEHDLLAEERGERGDAEVELARAAVDLELDLDAAVLRQALLGDVELGHDLDARDERVAQLQRRMHHVVEHAVDAEADAHLLLVRLDVDVGGAALERVDQQHVDEPDDRRVLAHPRQVREVDLVVVFDDLEPLGAVGLEVERFERHGGAGQLVEAVVDVGALPRSPAPARSRAIASSSARWPPARSPPRRPPARC